MIKAREEKAKRLGLYELVSYTVLDNFISSNNLIKEGFLLYVPEEGEDFAGLDVLYWQKYL